MCHINDPAMSCTRQGLRWGILLLVVSCARAAPAEIPFNSTRIEDDFEGVASIFATDLDGDEDLDIVAVGGFEIAWWENNGSPLMSNWPMHDVDADFDAGASVVAADVDGDGDIDLIAAATEDDQITWWQNNGDPRVEADWRRVELTNGFDGASAVHAVDLDGDGDIDILGAAKFDDRIAWWENRGNPVDPNDWAVHIVDSGVDGASSVFAADIDGDLDLDIVGVGSEVRVFDDDLQLIAWWINDGNPRRNDWTRVEIDDRFEGVVSVFVGDIDGDDDSDVVASSRDGGRVDWWENGGAPMEPANWVQRKVNDGFDGANSVWLADVDADGDLDILGAARQDDDIVWWENDGGDGVRWIEQKIDSDLGGATSVHAADIDSDGDVDVIGAGIFAFDIIWYENGAVPLTNDFAATGNAAGWLDAGTEDATRSAVIGTDAVAGLCVFSPLEGQHFAVWESPRSQAIPLARNSVYRVRFSMSSDQAIGSAQPLWNILVDNFNPSTGEVLWGSERWFFGNTEFANAIGNSGFDGLTEFDAWIVPVAVATDAWNGVVDPANSPFDPANQDGASFNLKFRVLDVDPTPGATTEDTGTICIRSFRVDRFDLTALDPDGPALWGSETSLPTEVSVLALATSGAQSVDSAAQVTDDEAMGKITIALDEPNEAGPGQGEQGVGRAFVQFEDTGQSEISNARFFPAPWNDGELLRLTSEIRAPAAGGTAPVDVIGLGWQAATNELGGFDFAFRGAPGGLMDRAASPRDDSVANSLYTSFFYTHHSTDVDLSLIADANRLRGVLDFFNRTDLAGALGAGALSDPFEVRSMAIHRIVYRDALFGSRPAEE